jgi:hypothetical protein
MPHSFFAARLQDHEEVEEERADDRRPFIA